MDTTKAPLLPSLSLQHQARQASDAQACAPAWAPSYAPPRRGADDSEVAHIIDVEPLKLDLGGIDVRPVRGQEYDVSEGLLYPVLHT